MSNISNISKKDIAKAKQYLAYKNDPVKFMEECCYLPQAGGDQLVKLYEPQKKIVREFYAGNNHQVLLKSRQCGFSTLWQLVSAHLCVFYKNVIIGVTSRDGSEASDFCRKTYDIIDKLPPWLHPGYKWKNIRDFCTKKGTQFRTSAISLSNPGGLFRGKSITLLILDEAAHAQKVEESWTGVAPALSIAQKRAKLNNIPHGTIILSTPNRTTGIGKFFFDMWTGATEGTNGFKPYKIHWSEIDELRNDPTWYKRQCEFYNNDPRKIAQELDLKFVGSGDTLFPEKTQTALQNIVDKPTRTLRLIQGGELRIYEEPVSDRFYLIGVDTASSYGGDFSAVQVMDYKSMRQIMEYKGKLEPKSFANVVRLISSIVPKNLIIVENTGGYGLTILNELQFDEEITYNLFEEYKDIKPETKTQPERRSSHTSTRKLGLSTNTKTRPLIVQSLYEAVVEDPSIVRSERFVNELLALVDKNGKVQADEGANDDLCFAYAFCCYVRKFYHENIIVEEDVGEDNESITIIQDIQEMNGFSVVDKQDMAVRPDEFKRDLQNYIDRQIKENKQVDPVRLIWGDSADMFGHW